MVDVGAPNNREGWAATGCAIRLRNGDHVLVDEGACTVEFREESFLDLYDGDGPA